MTRAKRKTEDEPFVTAEGANTPAPSDGPPPHPSASASPHEWGGARSDAAPAGEQPSETAGASGTDLQQELAEVRGKWLRAEAEVENVRKRLRRELDEHRLYASIPLLADLLNVLDNLERAIEAADGDAAAGSLLEGVKMVAESMRQTLQVHGCQPISALGEPFDPNRHEAVTMEPSADVAPHTVTRQLRTGYQLHDRVIRPSQVVVAAPAPTD